MGWKFPGSDAEASCTSTKCSVLRNIIQCLQPCASYTPVTARTHNFPSPNFAAAHIVGAYCSDKSATPRPAITPALAECSLCSNAPGAQCQVQPFARDDDRLGRACGALYQTNGKLAGARHIPCSRRAQDAHSSDHSRPPRVPHPTSPGGATFLLRRWSPGHNNRDTRVHIQMRECARASER